VQRNLLSAHPLRCRCLAAPKLIGGDKSSISKAFRQRNGYTVSESTANKTISTSTKPLAKQLHRIRNHLEFEGHVLESHRRRSGSPTKRHRNRSSHPQQPIGIEATIDHEAGFKESATPGHGVMAIEHSTHWATTLRRHSPPDRAHGTSSA